MNACEAHIRANHYRACGILMPVSGIRAGNPSIVLPDFHMSCNPTCLDTLMSLQFS